MDFQSRVSENVKAHSNRAIEPSWALYKEALLHNILEAADWSSESTFGKFYLRDFSADVLHVDKLIISASCLPVLFW